MTNQTNKKELEPNFRYESGKWVEKWVPITPERKKLLQQATINQNNYQSKFTLNNYSKSKWITNKYKKK